MSHSIPDIKEEAHGLIDRLPDDAAWDDIVYALTVRRAIERGIADADTGRVLSISDVQKEFEDR